VAVADLSPGNSVGIGEVQACQRIPAGHKVAVHPIAVGAEVIKYGRVIGIAKESINPGEHVHSHNLGMGNSGPCSPSVWVNRARSVGSERDPAFFKGFVRPDGAVGTRNCIGVLATVSCANGAVHLIADAITGDLLSRYSNVDGIVPLGHGGGCCMAPGSEGLDILQRTLAGYARNPNFGGITTIIEKSMGAVAKSGTTPLNAVYRYAEPVKEKGLVFMDTPGYDVVSITGMIAGGASLVCFTTGRGTVCGFRPVPTLKLASTSDLYRQLPDDMDIDCGRILEGGGTLEELSKQIFLAMLDTASGRPTRSEALGFGSNEFVPWPMGAVL